MSARRGFAVDVGRTVVHALGRSKPGYVVPWRATIRDDLGLRRPVLVIARILRLLVRVRTSRWTPRALRLRAGVTVVIVNWNGLELLPSVLTAVRRFSPPDTEILVVDNASSDGSRELLQTMSTRGQIRTLLLPRNLYHGPAMDLGFLVSHTEVVVALDVDAFPVRDDWLDALTGPLSSGVAVSGAQAARGYVHPCCLAMRLERFAAQRHTFTPHLMGDSTPPLLDDDWSTQDLALHRWDTGESITGREGRNHCAFLPRTLAWGPHHLGSVFGDVVFHNGASTRIPAGEMVDGITIDDVRDSWDEAVAKHLTDPTAADRPEPTDPSLDLSIVIAARDAAATLDDQLDALLAQDTGDLTWEVIVVDNHSVDATAAIAADHTQRDPRVRVVAAFDRLGAGYARNAGARAALGRALAFCDADDVVGDGWIVAMSTALRRHQFVTGPTDVAALNPSWLAASRGFAHTQQLTEFEDVFPYASGCNIGVTRTAFDAVGGFDIDYQIIEDLDLSRRLWAAGISLAFDPAALVHYRYPTDQHRALRQARRYARGRVQICEDLRRGGVRTPSPIAGMRNWVWLVRHLGLATTKAGRARWIWVLGNRVGTVEGALAARRLYL